MKIAQKFIWLAAFFFITFLITSTTKAQVTRSTTFDDRQACNENKGLWREFGNGCGDNCTNKFDQYEICTRALTFACDCGKGRCWHNNQCLTIASYKEIFDKESAEEEKLLEAKVQERQERIKKDPALSNYLQNLYVQKDATAAATGPNAASGNQAPGQAQMPTQNAITQVSPQIVIQAPSVAITPAQGTRASAANSATENQEIKIPPIFLQQEIDKNSTTAIDKGAPALPALPLP